MRKLATLLLAAILLVPTVASAIGVYEYSYKKILFAEETITGNADSETGEKTITFTWNPDVFLILWDADATNMLHVQLNASGGDSSHVLPSTVFHIAPDEAIPFPVKNIESLTVDLPYDADSGVVRVIYWKL